MIDLEEIPRCPELDGSTLTLIPNMSMDPNRVAITDGERTALYVPAADRRLSSAPTGILRSYTEGGWFTEAQCVTLTDGTHRVLFVPEEPIQV